MQFLSKNDGVSTKGTYLRLGGRPPARVLRFAWILRKYSGPRSLKSFIPVICPAAFKIHSLEIGFPQCGQSMLFAGYYAAESAQRLHVIRQPERLAMGEGKLQFADGYEQTTRRKID